MGAAGRSLTLVLLARTPVPIRGVVVALMLGACGGDETALPEQVAPPPQLAAVEPPPPATSIYGEDGELRESDQLVAGLPLPLGVELVSEEGRRHVYRSAAPLPKMQSYFGVRLVTGQVDARPGGGATYHDAVPRGVRGGQVHLEVTLDPSSVSQTRLEIEEIAPPIVSAPPESETIDRVQERLRQAD